jgi:hypothetical protein
MNQYTEHSAAVAAPPQRRRRPALSCAQCRRRKIRCDQKRPSCSQCERSKDIVCSYKPVHSSSLQSTAKIQETSNAGQPKPFNVLEDVFHINTSNRPTSSLSDHENTHNANQSRSSNLPDRTARLPGNPDLEDLRRLNDKLPTDKLWPHMLYSPEIERHVVPSSSIFAGSNQERSSAFKMKLIGETHWMNIVSQVSCPCPAGYSLQVLLINVK